MNSDPFVLKFEELCKVANAPEAKKNTLLAIYQRYASCAQGDPKEWKHAFETFVRLVFEQSHSPFTFNNYHEAIRSPFDYYQFGLDFTKPLLDLEHSTIQGQSALTSLQNQLEKGENVVLLANHQTELDPQIMSLLLSHISPKLAEKKVCVAGHRVTTDPMSIPFSLGCNLVCIYSKKYIEIPPEQKEEKLRHNQRSLKELKALFDQGGQVIYVAPSGGRDRRNEKGEVEVASFDPQSIEIFNLIGKQSLHPVHFYPLALQTYDILPPPTLITAELGETRTFNYAPVHFFFCDEVDLPKMEADYSHLNRKEARLEKALRIHSIVKEAYKKLN